MPEFIPVLESDDIQQVVAKLARTISADYKDRDLVLIGVLKGAFIFLADLVRHLTIPVSIDFIRVASYGAGTSSSGSIRLTKEVEMELAGKDVLIVEDIVDTGLTLSHLVDHIKTFSPRSVEICTLIDKYERRQTEIHAKYVGHETGQGFLVGYGLDHDEAYRGVAWNISPEILTKRRCVMIISCQQCNTRFNLDENLLDPQGSKVRCSVCANVFTAVPPGLETPSPPPPAVSEPDPAAHQGPDVDIPDIEEEKSDLRTESEDGGGDIPSVEVPEADFVPPAVDTEGQSF